MIQYSTVSIESASDPMRTADTREIKEQSRVKPVNLGIPSFPYFDLKVKSDAIAQFCGTCA